MARLVSNSAARVVTLTGGWQVAQCEAGAVAGIDALARADLRWLAATVPGTAAQALRAAGALGEAPHLDDFDFWFRCPLQWSGDGDAVLRLDGLATVADVWLDGKPVLHSENMFHAHRVKVSGLGANSELCLRFSALTPWLAAKKGRPRWKQHLVQPQSLRWARTTQLGRIASWCPPFAAVGPWREVALEQGPLSVESASVHAALEGDDGVVRAELRLSGPLVQGLGAVTLKVGEWSAPLSRTGDGVFSGALRAARPQRWWPHTHGTPALYEVSVQVASATLSLGRTGFRSVKLEQGGDDFALRLNGERIFCRGACWGSTDVLGLPSTRADYAPLLELTRDANMNMLRVTGCGVYEGPAFHALCDELGLLVWQDFMFARLDYPLADPGFKASVEREVREQVSALELSPSLAVLCGGTETAQTPAMLGLDRSFFDVRPQLEVVETTAAAARPDVPYVPSSPWGGDLPFSVSSGCSHYYGVGAYQRGLDDARRAEVRFASECLAFANLPDTEPDFGARVVRDPGASWSFADVRDHYLELLYRVSASELRREDPARYWALSQEVSGEVMHEVFGEWRRARSTCRGGLVLQLQDYWAGAGWGVVDSEGHPKPALHHLKRAFAPRAVFLTDEGVNGLGVHVVNDAPAALDGTLTFELLRDGRVNVGRAQAAVSVPPRRALELSAFALLGAFFDVSRAYRFGPPSHDAAVATLSDSAGALLSQTVFFPQGRQPRPARASSLTARCVPGPDEGWSLELSADALVQSVRVRAAGFDVSDGGFHLVPGHPRVVRLRPRRAARGPLEGEVVATTLSAPVRFTAPTS
ncbi:MAG: glycoside hydrolase family 2 protein [Archangiaceae bacterium]|nr:glycoside hydrolase family 2 protein [Archangiaceae bacterium]